MLHIKENHNYSLNQPALLSVVHDTADGDQVHESVDSLKLGAQGSRFLRVSEGPTKKRRPGYRMR